MVKILAGLGAAMLGVAVFLAVISEATIRESGPPQILLAEPIPAGPLGPNDYMPPLSDERAAQIHLVDPRPDDHRTCHLVGQHWASQGCTLRMVLYACHGRPGKWSHDTHTWKFDGYACRYGVESENVPAPREAQK